MRKTDAFKLLGYDYKSARGIWSAEREGGVLLTLWQREIGWMPGPRGGTLYCDVEEIHPLGSPRRTDLIANPKMRRQARHLRRVASDPSLSLDIVILFGPVGNDKGEAMVWKPEEYDGKVWKLKWIDHETGFYRVEALFPTEEER